MRAYVQSTECVDRHTRTHAYHLYDVCSAIHIKQRIARALSQSRRHRMYPDVPVPVCILTPQRLNSLTHWRPSRPSQRHLLACVFTFFDGDLSTTRPFARASIIHTYYECIYDVHKVKHHFHQWVYYYRVLSEAAASSPVNKYTWIATSGWHSNQSKACAVGWNWWSVSDREKKHHCECVYKIALLICTWEADKQIGRNR